MIQPNFELMLYGVYCLFLIDAIGHIILGAKGAVKDTHYNGRDVVIGVMMLIALLIIALL